MKFKVILNIVGKILLLEAAVLILPLIVSLIYQEGLRLVLSYAISIVFVAGIGLLLNIKKATDIKLRTRDGFMIVVLSWFLMSLFGTLPLMISGDIPSFYDAFFEITSGFTTTGASVLNDVEILHKSILFWRCFSHWLGGMGILVLILAIIPEGSDGSTVHILRAESTGPQVGKLVSRVKASSRILYLIYIGVTLLEFVLLLLGPDKNIGLFESIVLAFSTAGTGGFAPLATSIVTYSSYTQYVLAIFMIVFSINFTLYYLIIIGKWKDAIKSEELRTFICIVLAAIILIIVSIYKTVSSFEEAFRLSFFEVAATISTTGFAAVDFGAWPSLAQWVLVLLMFIGGCAGSTGGGIKVSRIALLFKNALYKVRKMINPRRVKVMKYEGTPVSTEVIESTQNFFVIYMLIIGVVTLVVSLLNKDFDVLSNFTGTLSCISNVGPGLGRIGAFGNFADYNGATKIIYSLVMIAGRLEIYPLLILLAPATWRRK